MSTPLVNSGRGPRQQFELSIGRVTFRLQMSDRKLFGAASARYRAFTDAAAPPIKIALNDGALAAGRAADFAYEFEGAALRAFRSEIRFHSVRNQYALDSLLRVLLSWKLLGRRGFLRTRPPSFGMGKPTYLRAARAPGRARWHRCLRKAASSLTKSLCFAGNMECGARTELLFGANSGPQD